MCCTSAVNWVGYPPLRPMIIEQTKTLIGRKVGRSLTHFALALAFICVFKREGLTHRDCRAGTTMALRTLAQSWKWRT